VVWKIQRKHFLNFSSVFGGPSRINILFTDYFLLQLKYHLWV